MVPKWTVRRPTPIPRSGNPQRFAIAFMGWMKTGRRRGPRRAVAPVGETRLSLLYRNAAAALALAGVLSGASAVAGLAPALALALVLALAVVLGRGRAAALALASVLSGASAVAGLAAAVALTRVHALTGMLFLVRGLCVRGQHLGPGHHAGHHRAHDLRELSTVHAGPPCVARETSMRAWLFPATRVANRHGELGLSRQGPSLVKGRSLSSALPAAEDIPTTKVRGHPLVRISSAASM